tara:strand:- start:8824 stop:9591 length:768 start_codon:yes stop_codon:yes gene_type:complete
MYTIQIAHKDKGTVVYNIYTKGEADERKIPYKHWTKASIGEYALSDDNYVAKVIQRKSYTDNKRGSNDYIRMPWGYCFHNPNRDHRPFNVGGRKSNTTYSGKRPIEVRAKQKPMQDLAIAYGATWDYNMAIDTVFKDATPSDRRKYTRYMKSEVFKTMVQDNLKALLEDKGYSEGDIIDLLSTAMEMAKDKKDITNFIRVIENIQDMLGMKDKKVVKTENQLTATNTKALLEELKAEEAQLNAKQTIIEETTNSD